MSAIFSQTDAWRTNSYIDTTRAIVDKGTLAIDEFKYNTGDRILYKGHYYSEKQPGIALLLTPVYGSFKLFYGPIPTQNSEECNNILPSCPEDSEKYRLFIKIAIILICGIPTAGTVFLIFLITKKRSKNLKMAFFLSILFFAGTTMTALLKQFNNTAITMFLVLLFYYMLFVSENKHRLFYAGIASFVGIMCATISLVPFIALGCTYIITNKKKNIILIILPIILGIIGLTLFSYIIIDRPTLSLHSEIDSNTFRIKNNEIFPTTNKNDFFVFEYSFIQSDFQSLKMEKMKSFLRRTDIIYYIPYPMRKMAYSTTENTNIKYISNNHILIFNGTDKIYYHHNSSKIFSNVGDISDQILLLNNLMGIAINKKGNKIIIQDSKHGINITTTCPFVDTMYINETKKIGICKLKKSKKNDNSLVYIIYRTYTFKNKTIIDGWITPEIPHPIIKNSVISLQILLGPYNGFFIFSPILLLGLFCLLKNIKRNNEYKSFLLILFITTYILQTGWIWWGGTGYGAQNLSFMIPLMFIPFIDAYSKHPQIINRQILSLFIIVGVCLGLLGFLYMKPPVLEYKNGFLNAKEGTLLSGNHIVTINTPWELTKEFKKDIYEKFRTKYWLAIGIQILLCFTLISLLYYKPSRIKKKKVLKKKK